MRKHAQKGRESSESEAQPSGIRTVVKLRGGTSAGQHVREAVAREARSGGRGWPSAPAGRQFHRVDANRRSFTPCGKRPRDLPASRHLTEAHAQ